MRDRSRAVGSTYRLQLTPGFDFAAAAAVVGYLAELGITHLYLSPVLEATPGSTHGYDVVDHGRVRAELGGEGGFESLATEAAHHGLGLVIDIVPNHMAIGPANRWWWDVLENGPSSTFADHFDVDWDPPTSYLRNRVLLPVLGDHYGRVLDAGELRLVRDGAAFAFAYYEQRFPVGPRSLGVLLGRAAARTGSPTLGFLADHLTELPAASATDRESCERRQRDLGVLRAGLADLLTGGRPGTAPAAEVVAAVDAEVEAANADPAVLHDLLERQSYRLAWWRTAASELDYRRFFDITDLVGLNVEHPHVFDAIHAFPVRWVERGLVDGLRVDHLDGLRQPEEYLRRLTAAAPGAWIVVEKILERGEALPPSWPVAGTTGYDFAARVGALLVDPAATGPLTALYERFTGEVEPFEEVARRATTQVLEQLLATDVNRVTELLAGVCEAQLRHRDHPRATLRAALTEILASFPVYRTYGRPGAGGRFVVDAADRDHVEGAVADVRARRADLDPDLLGFVAALLEGEVDTPEARGFVERFQQLSGPAHAKGHEDTAFYRFTRFVAANEVGGDPGHLGVDLDGFHAANATAAAHWPAAMTATSTHDTKRSEDVRARLALLAEIPDEWAAAVDGWHDLTARHRGGPDGAWPDAPTELLLYQTLVGAHPLPVERLQTFATKAIREAKAHTAWTAVDEAYEAAVAGFIDGALGDEAFLADLDAFVRPLVAPGRVTALTQVLVKLTSPGVPDTYQGTELWDDSLVDPDNRRPVDWDARRRLLAELATLTPEEVVARDDEGLPKLLVVHRALRLRQERLRAFVPEGGPSTYAPLAAAGERARHLVAFARGGEVVTLAPRLALGLAGDWRDTTVELPPGSWRDVLTDDVVDGGTAAVAKLLGRFPVALLARQGA